MAEALADDGLGDDIGLGQSNFFDDYEDHFHLLPDDDNDIPTFDDHIERLASGSLSPLPGSRSPQQQYRTNVRSPQHLNTEPTLDFDILSSDLLETSPQRNHNRHEQRIEYSMQSRIMHDSMFSPEIHDAKLETKRGLSSLKHQLQAAKDEAKRNASAAAAAAAAAAASSSQQDQAQQYMSKFVQCPKCEEILCPPQGYPRFLCQCGQVLKRVLMLPKQQMKFSHAVARRRLLARGNLQRAAAKRQKMLQIQQQQRLQMKQQQRLPLQHQLHHSQHRRYLQHCQQQQQETNENAKRKGKPTARSKKTQYQEKETLKLGDRKEAIKGDSIDTANNSKTGFSLQDFIRLENRNICMRQREREKALQKQRALLNWKQGAVGKWDSRSFGDRARFASQAHYGQNTKQELRRIVQRQEQWINSHRDARQKYRMNNGRYDYNNVSLENPADVRAYFLLKKMFQPSNGLKRKARGQETLKAAKIRRTQNGKASAVSAAAAAAASQATAAAAYGPRSSSNLDRRCLAEIFAVVSQKFKDVDELLSAFHAPDNKPLSRMTIPDLRTTIKIIKEHNGTDKLLRAPGKKAELLARLRMYCQGKGNTTRHTSRQSYHKSNNMNSLSASQLRARQYQQQQRMAAKSRRNTKSSNGDWKSALPPHIAKLLVGGEVAAKHFAARHNRQRGSGEIRASNGKGRDILDQQLIQIHGHFSNSAIKSEEKRLASMRQPSTQSLGPASNDQGSSASAVTKEKIFDDAFYNSTDPRPKSTVSESALSLKSKQLQSMGFSVSEIFRGLQNFPDDITSVMRHIFSKRHGGKDSSNAQSSSAQQSVLIGPSGSRFLRCVVQAIVKVDIEIRWKLLELFILEKRSENRKFDGKGSRKSPFMEIARRFDALIPKAQDQCLNDAEYTALILRPVTQQKMGKLLSALLLKTKPGNFKVNNALETKAS